MRASEFITNEQLDEDWRKWVAGGALAASALMPMASQAQSYYPPQNTSQSLSQMSHNDSRVQDQQDIRDLAKVFYDNMVRERGQPMDARQKSKWMQIAQTKAEQRLSGVEQQTQNTKSNLYQPSEYRTNRMGSNW
jgi:hypothetical protein